MPLLLESTTISWSATLNLSVLLNFLWTISASVRFKHKMQLSLSFSSSPSFCQFERFKHEVQNSLSVLLHIPSACFFRLEIQSTKCNQSTVGVIRDSRRRRRWHSSRSHRELSSRVHESPEEKPAWIFPESFSVFPRQQDPHRFAPQRSFTRLNCERDPVIGMILLHFYLQRIYLSASISCAKVRIRVSSLLRQSLSKRFAVSKKSASLKIVLQKKK